MELTLHLDPLVIEYFIKRRFDEQAQGCCCYECELTRALCIAVLQQHELELRERVLQ